MNIKYTRGEFFEYCDKSGLLKGGKIAAVPFHKCNRTILTSELKQYNKSITHIYVGEYISTISLIHNGFKFVINIINLPDNYINISFTGCADNIELISYISDDIHDALDIIKSIIQLLPSKKELDSYDGDDILGNHDLPIYNFLKNNIFIK